MKRNVKRLGAVLVIMAFSVVAIAENLPETKFLYVIDDEYRSEIDACRKRVESY